MTRRQTLLRLCTAAFVALAVLTVPALAAELLGVLTKVDVENKKVTVETKGGGEVLVTVTDETELETPKGSMKLELEKLEKQVSKIKEKGRKGLPVVVTHEDAVASKIKVERKKKGQ